jgi:prepilin-type N-terminal cleavage/methylation domain-containing protein
MFDIIKQNYFKGRLKNNLNNNMNKNNKGFTLIELLVVIAIIGILAGLIIVSLGDATNQAKEAKIKSALDQLRPIAQIHYNKYGDYTTTQALDNDPKVKNISTEISDNGGSLVLNVAQYAWCAFSDTPANNCMCVDSKGGVKEAAKGGCSCDTTSNLCKVNN